MLWGGYGSGGGAEGSTVAVRCAGGFMVSGFGRGSCSGPGALRQLHMGVSQKSVALF